MKLRESILFADSLKPNAFTEEQKLLWLNELEGRIQSLIHGFDSDKVIRYTMPEDEERELIVPSPYDSVYWKWLCAMIDYANGEYDKYINTQMSANSVYQEYAKWVVRTKYEPVRKGGVVTNDPDERLEGVLPGE